MEVEPSFPHRPPEPTELDETLRRNQINFKRRFIDPVVDDFRRTFSETLIRAPIGIYMCDDDPDKRDEDGLGTIKEILLDGRKSIIIKGSALRRLHRPWSRALIVKMLGKSTEFKFLYNRLVAQWKLYRGFELTDLENGFYCVRFYCEEDYDRVLLGGPWMVAGHYLTVQKWIPHFDPQADTAPTTPVWIRLRGLSIEYFDEDVLMDLGNGFGRSIKVDLTMIVAARGKFACICVKLNLANSMLPEVVVNGKEILVEYEGLDQICFHCVRFGHRRDRCPDNMSRKEDDEMNTGREKGIANSQEIPNKSRPEFGEWMIAKNRRRKPVSWKKTDPDNRNGSGKKTDSDNRNGSEMKGGSNPNSSTVLEQTTGVNTTVGSRFGALTIDTPDTPVHSEEFRFPQFNVDRSNQKLTSGKARLAGRGKGVSHPSKASGKKNPTRNPLVPLTNLLGSRGVFPPSVLNQADGKPPNQAFAARGGLFSSKSGLASTSSHDSRTMDRFDRDVSAEMGISPSASHPDSGGNWDREDAFG